MTTTTVVGASIEDCVRAWFQVERRESQPERPLASHPPLILGTSDRRYQLVATDTASWRAAIPWPNSLAQRGILRLGTDPQPGWRHATEAAGRSRGQCGSLRACAGAQPSADAVHDIAELEQRILASGMASGELVRAAWAPASILRAGDLRGGANGAWLRLAPQKDTRFHGKDR